MQGSPLEQFSIYKVTLLGYSISWLFTNFLFFAVIILLVAGILFGYGSSNYKIVPDRWGGLVETYYFYVYSLIKENSGERAQIFLPFLSTVFFFILISNLLGMIPFGYALTSQILITFWFSCSIFLGTIFLGLRRHGINFFSLFFPSGSPAYMAFLLVPIEILSFIARPFSLGIRLFANMLAGHVLLKILSTFILIGVFATQGLEISGTSLFFEQSWIAKKLSLRYLPGDSFHVIGPYRHDLAELTRVYAQPKVLDFSQKTRYVFTDIDSPEFLNGLKQMLENKNTATGEQDLRSNIEFFTRFTEKVQSKSSSIEKAAAANIGISKNVSLQKHFSFMYNLPPSSRGTLFSFSMPFKALLNFSLTPMLLGFKLALIMLQISLLLAFVVLELGIAFLQAYVFLILTTIYINDSLQLH